MKKTCGYLVLLFVVFFILSSCGEKTKTYTITWKNEDGTVLKVDEKVKEGTIPSYKGDEPTKSKDAEYSYAFSSWTPTIKGAVEDATYTAKYTKTPVEYTITFKVDGEVNSTRTFTVESESITVPELPPKAGYTGLWGTYNLNLLQNQEVEAVYTPITYKLTFKVNDEVIEVVDFNVETEEIVEPTVPLKEGYKGVWGEYDLNLLENQEVEAAYTINKYKVTFEDYSGIVKEETLEYGSPIVIPTEIPESYVDLETGKTKVFFDWGEVPETVPAHDVVYQARYKSEDECLVVFRKHDNTIFKEVYVVKNSTVSEPTETPERAGYTFVKWMNGDVEYNFELEVLEDLNLTPTYDLINYKITFKVGTEVIGAVNFNVETEEIEEPVVPNKEGHTGVWGEYDLNLLENQEVQAVYTKNKYKVTWKNYDGTVLEEDLEVPYGEMPEYNGDEPVKPGEFEFAGWSPIVSPVKGNIEYTAVFTSTLVDKTEDYIFIDKGDYYSILSYIGNDIDVTLPATYNEKPVISVEQWAFDKNETMRSLVVPDSIIYIYEDAFYDCTALKNVTLGNSVKLIGMDAFDGCTLLESINLPESLEEIQDRAFSYCPALTSISLPNSIKKFGAAMFMGSAGITYTVYENGNYLGNSTNPHLVLVRIIDKTQTTIKIHDNCKVIADYALSGSSLTTIDFGSGVEIIGMHAFRQCSDLKEVIIPNNVTTILEAAFQYLSITKVTIGDNVKYIGDSAFESCGELETVVLPNSLEEVGVYAFSYCNALVKTEYENAYYLGNATNPHLFLLEASYNSANNITIHENTKIIDSYAFSGCKYLTTITIPEAVKSIGVGIFYGCNSLTEVIVSENNTVYKAPNNTAIIEKGSNTLVAGLNNTVIPEGVTSIGDFAFNGCNELVSLTIPDGVISIGMNVFSYCEKLETIVMTDSVKYIGGGAFNNCYKLSSVTLSNNLVYFADGVFNRCYLLADITIPDSVSFIGQRAFCDCKAITNITIGSNVTVIFDYAFERCEGLTSVTIPNNVIMIKGGAFSECKALTSVNIGSGLKILENYVFSSCVELIDVKVDSMNQIYDSRDNCNAIIETATNILVVGTKATVIPDTVTAIGGYAFHYCAGLESIILGDNITSIGNYAFYRSGLTTITLGSELVEIGIQAFSGNYELTTIIIPESVTVIGNGAFRNCITLSIYAEATAQPEGWDEKWNSSDRPVYWYSETSNTDGSHWRYVDGIPTVWE